MTKYTPFGIIQFNVQTAPLSINELTLYILYNGNKISNRFDNFSLFKLN